MFAASKTAAAAAGTPPPSTDPQFNYVTMLLHGDGTNGAQNNTFVDSSTNNFTITRNGTPTQGSFSPYGDLWSNFFASGQFLAMSANTAFVLDSSFTVEAWVCLSAVPALDADSKARGCVLSYYQNTNTSGYQLGVDKTDNLVTFFRNQTGTGIACSYNIQVGVWYHIAVVYNGTTGSIYIDGVARTTTTNNWSWVAPSTPTLRIGALTQSSYLQYFPGYISNVRIVKGTALYTSNFTPSTTPLTAVSGTSLLTCQSNRFRDNSSNNFAITVTGTPSVQRFSPFDPAAEYSTSVIGGSGFFGGVSDWMTVPASANTNVLGGDFTLEAFVYPASFNTYNYVVMQDDGNSGSQNLQLSYTSAGLTKFTTWSTSSRGSFWELTATTALQRNAWNHIAVTRSGTTTRLFVNGVQEASSTNTVWAGASIQTAINNFSAGPNQTSTYSKLSGYVTNVRVVKGTALYTAAFTPPTAPLTAITNTSLLLNTVNAGIYDNAMMNDLVTVGNAQVSTAVKKYGTGSMAFDGSGDWLTFIDTPNVQLGTGDFTIEGWVYLSALGSARGFLSKGTSTTGFSFGVNALNQLVFNYTATSLTATTPLVISTWYYVAVVRSGSASGNLKIYLNGAVDATSGGAVNDNFNQTSIGYVGADRVATSPMNGYIDDLRITKGIARTITTPTAALPNS